MVSASKPNLEPVRANMACRRDRDADSSLRLVICVDDWLQCAQRSCFANPRYSEQMRRRTNAPTSMRTGWYRGRRLSMSSSSSLLALLVCLVVVWMCCCWWCGGRALSARARRSTVAVSAAVVGLLWWCVRLCARQSKDSSDCHAALDMAPHHHSKPHTEQSRVYKERDEWMNGYGVREPAVPSGPTPRHGPSAHSQRRRRRQRTGLEAHRDHLADSMLGKSKMVAVFAHVVAAAGIPWNGVEWSRRIEARRALWATSTYRLCGWFDFACLCCV